jgi:hypothetical protein
MLYGDAKGFFIRNSGIGFAAGLLPVVGLSALISAR